MTLVEIWGIVIPAWLSAIGGLAAAGVSVIALLKSLKTQGGVETLKSAANATAQGSGPESLRAGEAHSPEATDAPPRVSPVSWTTWHESRARYRLRNDSTDNGATARLIGFEDVTPDGDGAASYAGPLPVDLAAGESIPFSIDKSFISPSVTAIKLVWNDQDETERSRVIYV